MKDAAEIVVKRSRRVCERCGAKPAQQIHHRKPRGMGGSKDPAINLPSNLLHLCLPCHQWVESHRGVSYEEGWLVRRGEDPEKTRVTYRLTMRRWLTHDGQAVVVCP